MGFLRESMNLNHELVLALIPSTSVPSPLGPNLRDTSPHTAPLFFVVGGSRALGGRGLLVEWIGQRLM